MATRTLVLLGAAFSIALLGAGAGSVQASGANPPESTAIPNHPLSTDWLTAAPLLPGASEAPACRADDPGRRAAQVGTAAKLARIREMLAAEAARAEGGPGEVVVLGNRGYNYGANAIEDPALIEFEARRLGR